MYKSFSLSYWMFAFNICESLSFWKIFLCFATLGIRHRALNKLSKPFTTEPHSPALEILYSVVSVTPLFRFPFSLPVLAIFLSSFNIRWFSRFPFWYHPILLLTLNSVIFPLCFKILSSESKLYPRASFCTITSLTSIYLASYVLDSV